MDTANVSEQERENRRNLSRIAEEMSLRIALPRGSASCASSVCWGWSFNDAEVGAAAAALDASSRACFGEKPFIAIGYSNGGYLLTSLIRNCTLQKHLPRATKVFTIGSGIFRGPLGPYPASLSECGDLTMILGTEDAHNFDPSEHYLNVLRAKGANVRSVQFPGGHIVPFEPTRSLLSEEIAKTLTP